MFDVYCPLIVFPSIDNCVIYYYRLMYTKLPQQEPDIVFCTAELGINTPIVDSNVCMYVCIGLCIMGVGKGGGGDRPPPPRE